MINDNLDWVFGDGHFVVTGDIFDRGSKVLDSLWLILKWEKQAKAKGGKVHYLLGNHEYMALRGEQKYIHKKYLVTSRLPNTQYKNLFNSDTVLGRWIRSKSTIIKINNTVFLHAGISEKFLQHKSIGNSFDYKEINQRYRETIGMTKEELQKIPNYYALHRSFSPVWYGGYISQKGKPHPINGESDEVVDRILEHIKASRIVVGHTTIGKIMEFNNGKIYAIDANMKKGKRGELLLLNGIDVYRLTSEGEKIKLR